MANPITAPLKRRMFFLDMSKNRNGWSVTKEAIDADAETCIGKPLILYEECTLAGCKYTHKTVEGSEPNSYEDFLRVQEKYRVGTIAGYNWDRKAARMDVDVEITDPKTIEGIKGNILKFVSPALYINERTWLETFTRGYRDYIVNRFTVTHLAIVTDPAFGVRADLGIEETDQDGNTALGSLRPMDIQASPCAIGALDERLRMLELGRRVNQMSHA